MVDDQEISDTLTSSEDVCLHSEGEETYRRGYCCAS